MGTFFTGLYDFFHRHKWLFAVVFISYLGVFGFLASKLSLEEDLTKALPDDPGVQKMLEILSGSKVSERLTITISLKDTTAVNTDRLVHFGEALENKVNTHLTEYIKKAALRTDEDAFISILNVVSSQLPVFVDSADYAAIDTMLTDERLAEKLDEHLATLTGPAGMAMKKMIASDPAGIAWLPLQRLRSMQIDDNFSLYDNCITTRDGKNLLYFIIPAFPTTNSGKNAELITGLQAQIDTLIQTDYPDVETSVFGGALVSAGNAQQLRKDTWLTQTITITFLLVLFFFYFRKKWVPLIMLIPIACGLLFSMAMIYLIKGNMSVIAVAMGSVVFGIAVNYSIHLFNHYLHSPDIKTVIRELAKPMTIGSFTTIAGFMCLWWTHSPLLHDLGLFAALSLVGAALSVLVFVPHFAGKPDPRAEERLHWFNNAFSDFRPSKWLILGIVLLTVVFAYTARYVQFDADMMKLNFMSSETREAENKLNKLNAQIRRSIYVVAEGKDLEHALRANEQVDHKLNQLSQEGIVSQFSGVTSAFISDSLRMKRIRQWNNYWTPERSDRVMTTLQREGLARGFNASAFNAFGQLLYDRYTEPDTALLNNINLSLLPTFITQKEDHTLVVHFVSPTAAHRDDVYEAFKSEKNVTVVDSQYLSNTFASLINQDYSSIAWMTSIVVFLVLLITYGRIELALVTFIPMLVTWVWILGIMGMFGIKFNVINVVVSALIFGLGDDYSIFTMDGLMGEFAKGKKNSASYRTSVILSAITTLAGLGVLIFGKHPALKSIALISIIGICCVVFHSLVLIPALYRWLITNRVKAGKFPWTFKGLLFTFLAYSYFLIGCLLLSMVGLILIKLNPFAGRRTKLLYHTILSYTTRSILALAFNIKKKTLHRENADFNRPTIIIANHQSFLDILCSIAFHPKLILLTNKWVWNSPFFGFLIRMADYYPVVEGVEDGIEPIRRKVEDGYSVVVFPEGTRSRDGVIGRFHKGAFYLAEKFGLDIQPVVFHGLGYTITKGDFLVKDGQMTISFLPRIPHDDSRFGNTYQEKAKKTSQLMREEYAHLCTEIETTKYHRERLIYQYIYKGPVLEWYTRVKLSLEKNYELYDSLLPREGDILDAGCGYGFLSYMLHYRSAARNIVGIDYDEDKIDVAQHCASRPETVQFYKADLREYTFAEYDAVIMSDVLHYLDPQCQDEILQKAMQALRPGGVLLIREGNAELTGRQKATSLTEFNSTKIFRFNREPEQFHFLRATHLREIVAQNGFAVREIDNSRITSNIIFVISKANG